MISVSVMISESRKLWNYRKVMMLIMVLIRVLLISVICDFFYSRMCVLFWFIWFSVMLCIIRVSICMVVLLLMLVMIGISIVRVIIFCRVILN